MSSFLGAKKLILYLSDILSTTILPLLALSRNFCHALCGIPDSPNSISAKNTNPWRVIKRTGRPNPGDDQSYMSHVYRAQNSSVHTSEMWKIMLSNYVFLDSKFKYFVQKSAGSFAKKTELLGKLFFFPGVGAKLYPAKLFLGCLMPRYPRIHFAWAYKNL